MGRDGWGLPRGSRQILSECSPPFEPILFTGWAHERPMGATEREGLLHQLSQQDQDAGGLGKAHQGQESCQVGQRL